MKKRVIKNNKSGSALLIALVIMMVVTMLSLALLLVSYSLFSTANNQNSQEQCKALAQSLSRELENEITGPTFASYKDQQNALQDDLYPLWFYLRFNILQNDKWYYYNTDERNHSESNAYRYFKIDRASLKDETAAGLMDDISVLMYWVSETGADRTKDISLVVRVTCKKGKQQGVITTTYALSMTTYKDKDLSHELTPPADNPYCPTGVEIYPDECWTWSKSDRE